MAKKTLSIIVPAYNEEKTLAELIGRVIAVKFPSNIATEIIIVNDGSADKTKAIASKLSKIQTVIGM